MKQNDNKIRELINEIIIDIKNNPIDLLNNNNIENEINYLNNSDERYILLIKDVLKVLGKNNNARILEIGTFLGVTSICLSK